MHLTQRWQLYASHMVPLCTKSGNFMVPVVKLRNHKVAVLRKTKHKVAAKSAEIAGRCDLGVNRWNQRRDWILGSGASARRGPGRANSYENCKNPTKTGSIYLPRRQVYGSRHNFCDGNHKVAGVGKHKVAKCVFNYSPTHSLCSGRGKAKREDRRRNGFIVWAGSCLCACRWSVPARQTLF